MRPGYAKNIMKPSDLLSQPGLSQNPTAAQAAQSIAFRQTAGGDAFQKMAKQNVGTLNEAKIKKIVTTCPHCFNTIGKEYADFGGRYEVGVLLADGVEAMRAGGHDLFDLRLVQRAHVLFGHLLERVLVAHPASGVAGTRLAWPKDREVDASSLEQLRRRYRRLLRPLVERRRAPDPEEDVRRRLAWPEHSNAEPVCPMRAIRL